MGIDVTRPRMELLSRFRTTEAMRDLDGKTVVVDLPDSSTFVTAINVFDRLGIRPHLVYQEPRLAVDMQDGVNRGLAAAFFLGGLQLVEPLAVGGEAAGDEQFGNQFVLGAEMIVHRGEVDVCLCDDVAQGHVAEAAIGVKPFGGGKDGRPGPIARHIWPPFAEL